MQNGLTLFMSQRTNNQIKDKLFSNATPVLDSLGYPMNFEAFVSINYGSFPSKLPSSVPDRSTLLFSSIPG